MDAMETGKPAMVLLCPKASLLLLEHRNGKRFFAVQQTCLDDGEEFGCSRFLTGKKTLKSFEEGAMELGMRHISQTKMWKLFGLPSHWPSTTFIVLSSKRISIGDGPKLHLHVIILDSRMVVYFHTSSIDTR